LCVFGQATPAPTADDWIGILVLTHLPFFCGITMSEERIEDIQPHKRKCFFKCVGHYTVKEV
ncbi:hypothetical protein, partial [uncultured Phocaeicola sp.]